MSGRWIQRWATALSVLAIAACAESPVAPGAEAPSFDIVPDPGHVMHVAVCKVAATTMDGGADDGTLGESFDFTASATGGTILSASFSTPALSWVGLDPWVADCAYAWEGRDRRFDDVTEVTITELDAPDSELESVWQYTSERGFEELTATGGSVTVVPEKGKFVLFANRMTPPSGGGQGCTPGYWRQRHHYDSWVDYSPSDLFSDVFGAGPAIELGDAVKARGGGANAMMRHAVAALLNTTSAGVDYDLSESAVISAVQAAFASGDFEDTKDMFNDLNEQGCPLN